MRGQASDGSTVPEPEKVKAEGLKKLDEWEEMRMGW